MKFIFLSEKFYEDYNHCIEIEYKIMRPYIQICFEFNDILYCLPLRSNINHKYVHWTEKDKKCGVDFSKCVAIDNYDYIEKENSPFIRIDEFKALKGQEYIIKKKFLSYVKKFLKAKNNLNQNHHKNLYDYSTLQYFEKYLENLPL